jgi:hypothetical protein
MTDSPTTLWIDPTGVDELDMYVGHTSSTMDYLNMDVSYTRTDISQAEYKKGFDDGCAHIMEDYKAGGRLDLRASQARIAQLEAALNRQGDNMAFVLNHMDVKNWYDKFTTELAEDRAVLKDNEVKK